MEGDAGTLADKLTLPEVVAANRIKQAAKDHAETVRAAQLAKAAQFKAKSESIKKAAAKRKALAELPGDYQDQWELLPTPPEAVQLFSKEGEEGVRR